MLSLETTRTRHVGNDPNPQKYDPDLWTDEYAFLNKPGEADIQSDLFYDYRTNVNAYPTWQAWMQKTQRSTPRALGENTTYRSIRRSRRRTRRDVPARKLRFTSWMRGTSPWTPQPMKSPISFAVSWRTNNRKGNSMMAEYVLLENFRRFGRVFKRPLGLLHRFIA